MAIDVRRVVTGHNEKGEAVVLFDGRAENVISQRPLQERVLLWTTNTLPASNQGNEDGGAVDIGTGLKGGTVFGIVKLDPGVQNYPHRTETIDYGILLSGKLGLKLDVGEVVLNAGDVFVQRGTIHSWYVEGTEPAVMAVVMVGAEDLTVGGKKLGTAL